MKDVSVDNVNKEVPCFSSVVTPATSSSPEPVGSAAHSRTSPHLGLPTAHRTSLDSAFSEFSSLTEDVGQSSYDEILSDSHPRRGRIQRLWRDNKGVVHVLIAQVFGAGMNAATRILEISGTHGPGMHPFQILFIRQLITGVCSLAYMFYARTPDAPWGTSSARQLLILRGIFGLFGVCGMYFSLEYLPLSEATVLTFLAPVLTCYVCSFLIKGEVFTRLQQVAAFISLAGVVCIAKPPAVFQSPPSAAISKSKTHVVSDPPNSTITVGLVIANNATSALSNAATGHPGPTPHQHFFAIMISLVGVIGTTGALTVLRLLPPSIHPLISVTYFSFTCLLVSLLACALPSVSGVSFRLPHNTDEWLLLAALGACGFLTQVLLTTGLAHRSSANGVHRKRGRRQDSDNGTAGGNGTKATSMLYTQMLFALVADKAIWGESLGLWSWVGSGLILGSAVWVTIGSGSLGRGKGQGDVEDGSEEGVPLKGLQATDRERGRKRKREGVRGDAAKEEDEEDTIGLLRDEEELGASQSQLQLQECEDAKT